MNLTTGTPDRESVMGQELDPSQWVTSRRPGLPNLTDSPHLAVFLRHPTLVQPTADWAEARKLFGWAWELHVYALGSLFAVVAFYSLICILQLCRLSTTRSVRWYFITLHTVLFVFGLTRAVFLLLDPYNSRRILPQAAAAACLHLSFPCLTSAFSMVLAGLVRTARLKLLKSRVMNVYLLMGLLFGNFALAIGAEVIVDFTQFNVVSVASQTYFIAWSIGLGVGYLLMYPSLVQAGRDADGLEGGATRRIAVGVIITLLSAILLLCFAGLHIYGLIAVYGFLVPEGDYNAWRWYGFHVATRIAELLLASLLAFVAALTMWTRAARRISVQRQSANRVEVEDAEKRQNLLMHGSRIGPPPPPSPARNRRDFPVTFNPEGVKAEEEFFPGRFQNRQRKPVSQLLEGNPIHNANEDRYG